MFQHLKSHFASGIFLFTIILAFPSCNHYYKAVRPKDPIAEHTLDSLQNQSRYFILRSGSEAYYMTKIVLSEDRKTLKCVLDTLPQNHQLYLTHGRNGKMLYKPRFSDNVVLSEVHLFIKSSDSIDIGPATIALDKIQKIEVIEKDKKRTTNSYVIGALGYTVGAIAVAAIIVAATKSSCPFVSAYTNNEFLLQGEIYGGAIYPQLARDDYMPLQMTPTSDNTLRLKISNELKEQQYTDFADLEIVTHSKNSKVLCDEKGNLYSIANPQSPVAAWTGNNKDVMMPLLTKDDNTLLHFDDTLSSNATNYVVTKFSRPPGKQNGKLILSIKNSYWIDYLYGEVAKGFGSYYNTYIKKQYRKPASNLLQWARDQKLPLEVSVKTKQGWEKMADLTTLGPLATREIVVPVDLKNVDGSSIEIKLSSGFMFWEIDYAAIDFSVDSDFSVETVAPSIATDETGKDVLPLLDKKDGIYLEQPVPGNCVTLEYKCLPQRLNTSQTYILHTRGYYIHKRDLKGSPNIAFLKQFRKPGGLSSYSLELYKKFSSTSIQSLVKN